MKTKINLEQLPGTEFQKKVWRELCKVKRGEVVTYGELARRIGKPKAARAVANALGANPLPVHMPCHRVVRSDGSIGGYSSPGGTLRKRALLRGEGIEI